MNNALKGALLSGLGFPGLGQMVLKHYKRGFALMFVVFGSLLVIAMEAIQKAFTIVEKITSGGAVDMSRITEAATQGATTSESLIGKLAFFVIIVFWNIGVIDAYRIGKKKDIEQRLASEATNENE
jgi:TM2 domain-containing membrane protein YozV